MNSAMGVRCAAGILAAAMVLTGCREKEAPPRRRAAGEGGSGDGGVHVRVGLLDRVDQGE